MWTFGRTAARLSKLEDELKALGESFEGLRRLPLLLQSEWEDQLDRMNRVMGRLNARAKAASVTESDDPPEVRVEPPLNGPGPLAGTHGRLEAARARRNALLR